MAGKISGLYVAVTAAGAALVWSGWQNTSLTATFRSLLSGKLPAPGTGGAATPPVLLVGNTGAETKPATDNQALARQVIAADPSYAGWDSGADWQDLVSLWNAESGWSNTADNPSSGAYGIAQALPPTKYPAAGQPPPAGTSDAKSQIEWGLSYIAGRYGNPQMAWAHEEANRWY